MSHSPPAEYAELVEELGIVQTLSATISRKTSCKDLSQIFSHISNIIWRYYQDSVESVLNAARRCLRYLSSYNHNNLTARDNTVATEIDDVFTRLESLCAGGSPP